VHSKKRAVLAIGALSGIVAIGGIAHAAIPEPTEEGFTQERSAEVAAQIDPAKPRNVILIIGDGMDDSMITAARNYEYGAGGRFPALDALPFTGAMTTYGLKAGAGPDYPIAYVSDSAPTASGWSTGHKTIDGRLSQGPSSAANVPGENYETVLEQYKDDGKLVGNISTAEITDATPAAAASHISQRACQGPTDMTSCASEAKPTGLGSVAEQLVDNEVDVLMGGGMNRYAQATVAGPTALQYAQDEHDYNLVTTAAEMDAVTSLEDGPVLGLFTPGNMTPMYQPLVATAAGAGSATTKCAASDRGTQPDLSAMTEKAIELLDNPDGFFLQAESAMIDKQEHASDICGAIGDLKELDETVAVALAYQEEHPDTLIIATADHSHSTQIIAGNADDGVQRATLETADGDPMSVAYSTNAVGSDHTGTQVRVAAAGPQASNVMGVIDQTDLYLTLLGRTPSTLPGPGEPDPLKPAVSVLAGASKISVKELRKQGLPVVVAASGASKVTVKLIDGKKTLVTKTVGKTGGTVKLKSGKATPGPVKVTVTVTGAGGSATKSDSVRVTR
jgi:alkaline phosphatase